MRTLCALFLVALSATSAVRQLAAQDRPTATVLLNRYLEGRFAEVVASFAAEEDFKEFLDQLERDGVAWVDAGGTDRARRELVAATVALEAARLGAWKSWKQVEIVPVLEEPGRRATLTLYRVTRWQPPALLLEWGCELLRRSSKPTPAERWWQLAAMAVAERAEDPDFLVGELAVPGRYPCGPARCEIPSPSRKIEHLRHVAERLPGEPRFKLAQGIVVEWLVPNMATKVFDALANDIDVGGEATMRLGAIALRQGNEEQAVAHFRRVESLTREPWVVYLARYFSGQAFEHRKQPAEAERAYRGALAAVPYAQSASVALGSLLSRGGRRTEASQVIDAMLTVDPKPADPWRGYADADDRFWPELLTQLRTEIRR